MFSFEDIRLLHVIAACRSLTEAGEQLRLSQSQVSRRLAALERDWGRRLFYRHARGIAATAECLGICQRTQPALHALEDVIRAEASSRSRRARVARQRLGGAQASAERAAATET
jgi:DNA-binding transcriptional LysR family regulator